MNTKTTTAKTPLTIATMPPVPAGVQFELSEIRTISQPHPYCITPKHVAWAADHNGGMLTTDAIREAEKHGARCDICAKSGRGILTIDQHEQIQTLFIKIPAGVRDLNSIAGLHKYLYENKAQFEALGIQGFAFPPK